ncbi:alpha/beta fold hydrolase [Streptomyces sp. NPDC054956]
MSYAFLDCRGYGEAIGADGAFTMDPALGAGTLRETWMRWYPNARLEVLPGTGHYAPEESPEAVAAAVERYLGRGAPGPGPADGFTPVRSR